MHIFMMYIPDSSLTLDCDQCTTNPHVSEGGGIEQHVGIEIEGEGAGR